MLTCLGGYQKKKKWNNHHGNFPNIGFCELFEMPVTKPVLNVVERIVIKKLLSARTSANYALLEESAGLFHHNAPDGPIIEVKEAK